MLFPGQIIHEGLGFFFFSVSFLPSWSACLWWMLHEPPSPGSSQPWSLLPAEFISNHQKGMKSDKKQMKKNVCSWLWSVQINPG